ncbi:unnamed protein product [Fraxinus pennsylvanica]|uniref:Uncharacterized protein n=1 Tax=Fraxinus pennsylvanica TaxID=56036 RepID=A0AAD1ZWA8_9LAMI|nr:unnamed protein product [Fraxinus pennsylvanica]
MMTGIRGMITTTASRVVPLAIGSTFCSYHLTHSVIRTGLSGKLFHRLFPSSLHYYSTKSTFKELFMRGQEEKKFEKSPKLFHSTIEERSNQQTLLLTSKYKFEILNVEVHVPDVSFFDEDAAQGEEEVPFFRVEDDYYNYCMEKTEHFSIPFVAKVTYDIGKGLSFKLRCTAYHDKISLDCLTKNNCASFNQTDNDMIATLHKTYLMYLKVRGITPDIIYYLHELKVELNKVKRSFAEESQKLPRRSINSEELYRLFVSSLFDYCRRWRFDVHTLLDESNSKKKQLNKCMYFLSRKDKIETIDVEILNAGDVSAESSNDKTQENLSVVFSISIRGLFLSLYCTVYPDKISLESWSVEENSDRHSRIPYRGSLCRVSIGSGDDELQDEDSLY